VQRVFCSDLDREPGSVVYTCLLNRKGGIEVDVTVTRLAEDRFLVVAPSGAQTKTFHWLRRHVDAATTVTDVTSGCGVLAVNGPLSRDLLSRLTDARLDDRSFPFGTGRQIDIAWASALALRVSFAGELGWELYAPVDSLVPLYDQIVRAGAGLGLRHAGYHALDSLRAEKGFRHWGADMGPADTPYEAGLGGTVALQKDTDFIGRETLRVRAGQPATRQLLQVKLDDPEPLLYHGESLVREGRVVGRVTSGAYGHTLDAAVGLAYVEGSPEGIDEIASAGSVEVEIAGARVPATLSRRPFYDPGGARLRGVAAQRDAS
jgi:4-methylaminobutanoate oxidase (formaldehyde-forming)